MAKFTLKAGTELDVLTRDELETSLEEIASGYLRPPQTIRVLGGGVTANSGLYDVTFDIYKVPLGYRFVLLRLCIEAEGYTYGAPFSAVGSYWELLRNGIVEDGTMLDVTSGGFSIPFTYTESEDRSVEARDGELLQLHVVGDNTFGTKTVTAHGKGYLYPLSASV